jgi:hypothetical protein
MSIPAFPCNSCQVQVQQIAGADVGTVTYITQGPKAGHIQVVARTDWRGGEGVEFLVSCGDDAFVQVIRRATTNASAPTWVSLIREPCSKVTLNWAAPHDGGRLISYYEIQFRRTGTAEWAVIGRAASAATSELVTGLLPVSYEFRVRAFNGGFSPFSDIARIDDPLGPALNVAVTRNPCSVARVSWDAIEHSECVAVEGYLVQYREIAGGAWLNSPSGQLSEFTVLDTIPGLADDVPYVFRVIRIDAANDRLPSAVVRSGNVANPPISVSATASSTVGAVDLEWTVNEEACYENINYNVQRRDAAPGSEWIDISAPASDSTSRTVTGLAPGTSYVFRVRAINRIGRGEFSEPSNEVLIPQL